MGPSAGRSAVTGPRPDPQPGTVVLVPFPFTDLTGRKQRPAIVLSPAGFHPEDVVVCAVTSQMPESLTRWQLSLVADELEERRLPKPSVILVGKLFTIHRDLVSGQYGHLRFEKLLELRARLRELFADDVAAPATQQTVPRAER